MTPTDAILLLWVVPSLIAVLLCFKGVRLEGGNPKSFSTPDMFVWSLLSVILYPIVYVAFFCYHIWPKFKRGDK